jgi:hypothetical protein
LCLGVSLGDFQVLVDPSITSPFNRRNASSVLKRPRDGIIVFDDSVNLILQETVLVQHEADVGLQLLHGVQQVQVVVVEFEVVASLLLQLLIELGNHGLL